MEYKIETGVPVPTQNPRNKKYPFASMKPGESVFLDVPIGRIQGSIGWVKATIPNSRFTCRTVTENGVTGTRVWRIA